MDTKDEMDTKDRYGREREMLIEHQGLNRAQRRGMKRAGRSYVPRAQNKSYVIKVK